ncbi:MAG: hypothetical protein IMF10_04315 [Proteobacteria bacterium]|nr:hypothetical protein [Pseudomonadota bacterium]
MTTVAIHENEDSEKVVKFIDEYEFNKKGRGLINSPEFWGAFYDEGEIVIAANGIIYRDII